MPTPAHGTQQRAGTEDGLVQAGEHTNQAPIRRQTMRAVIQRRYGPFDMLDLEEVGIPALGDDQALVRVRAAAVNPGDVFSVTGRPYVVRLTTGPARPWSPVPGRSFSGTVERVGRKVSRFQPGDEVYGETSRGAYAEYVAVGERILARKPCNVGFEEAAAVPLSGVTALQGLRDKGRVAPGSRVLVNGASGGVGTFAVQIGRALGAEVTAVCSTRNVDLIRALGADHVIDYAMGEDFTRSASRFDVVLDLIGNHPLPALRRILDPGGTLVLSSGPPSPTIRRILTALVWSPFVPQRLLPLVQKSSAGDLEHLTKLIEAGDITPVIDRVYPLEEAAAALGYLARGHARGRTVLTMPAGDD